MKPNLRSSLGGMLVILCILCQALHAQDPNTIKAEIVALSWKGKIPGLWFQTKSGPQSLDVYDRGFTSPAEYTGARTIAFHGSAGDLNLPPAQQPEPVAIAQLPERGGQVLFLFTEKSGAKQKWQVQVMDNSMHNLPAGGYRVVNFTKEPYTALFDRTVTPVTASGITIIRPTKQDEVRDLAVQFGRGKQLVYSSVWGHQENRRGTIFLLPGDAGSQFISVRRYFQPVLQPGTQETP